MSEGRPARIVVPKAATAVAGPAKAAPTNVADEAAEPAPAAGSAEVDAAPQAAGIELGVQERALILPNSRNNRTFWICLALAVMLHVSPFLASALGVVSLMPVKRMGELDGDPDGISVEMVEEAQLAAMSPPPSPPAPPLPAEPPPQQPQITPPKEPPPPPPQQVAPQIRGTTPTEKPPELAKTEIPLPDRPGPNKNTADTAEAAKPAPERPVEEKPVPDKTTPEKPFPQKQPQPAKQSEADLLQEMREMFAPDPAQRNRTPPTRQANAQPPSANAPPSVLDKPIEFQANSSSFARPTDITRSGENDEFGRGVIRSLRQTMPPPLGLKARVTIAFVLSEAGQVVEMRLVRSSGYPLIDQSVVFAAGNSNFPRPPNGSKVSDRIFLVTYIYD